MKILQIITELGGGGAEKILASLTEEQIRQGHSVAVLSLLPARANPAIAKRLTDSGCTVQYLNAKKYDPFLILKLRKQISSLAPDLIHTHLIHANLLSRLACLGFRQHIPLINTIHTAEKRRGKGLYFLLDRLTRHLPDRMTAVSEAAARHHEKLCHLPAGTVKVIPNGLDPVQGAAEAACAAFRTQLNIRGQERIIACIGRMDAMKGFQYLPEKMTAISAVIPPHEKWVVVIFGDGEYRKILEQTPSSANLRIVCAGFRPDAPSLLAAADVFLSMSLCEGFGMAAAEAMALGLPVVCNRTDTMPELCSAYTGDSFLFDLLSDHKGTALAEQLAAAMQCGKSGGMVIRTAQEMAADYIDLYREAAE